MSRNRRKHANTIQVAAIVWWVIIFAFLGCIGLSYVYIKNQTVAFGDQRRSSERELHDLSEQNRALAYQVTTLTSRSALQHKLAAHVIEMDAIDSANVIRLGTGGTEMARLDQPNINVITP